MLGQCGKYRLEALVARGGMAEVFRATATGTSGFTRPVCIKRVRPELCDDPEFVEMFEREARISANLQHPNIVQVFDFDRYDGRLFLAMEYVEGMDVRHILKETAALGVRGPVEFALHVTEGLLEALKHAHANTVDGVQMPVIHRDISPHNILVSVDGFVKLTDFGIAKARGGSSATRTGVIKGKLAYLSPEQASAQEAGPASDLFGAGLVLWEMLSGRRLFRGKDDREVLAQVFNPRAPLIPWLSDGLNDFVQRLLKANPADRYASAAEALQVLAGLKDHRYSPGEAGRLLVGLMDLAAGGGATSIKRPSSSEVPAPQIRADEEKPTNDGTFESAPTNISGSDIPIAPGTIKTKRWSGRPILLALSALLAGVAIGAGFSLLGDDVDPSQVEMPVEQGEPVMAANGEVNEQPVVRIEPDERGSSAAGPVLKDAGAPLNEEVAKPVSTGYLQVNCRPWAKVTVDGRKIGTTPIKKLRLTSGAHRVVLANDELGFRKSYSVRVRAGKTSLLNKEIP